MHVKPHAPSTFDVFFTTSYPTSSAPPPVVAVLRNREPTQARTPLGDAPFGKLATNVIAAVCVSSVESAEPPEIHNVPSGATSAPLMLPAFTLLKNVAAPVCWFTV